MLDKPNAHRLLELAYHTIPMYGHALNISELALEQVHRNFKEWLEKNTHDDAHITAVEIALSKDWGMRAFSLYKLLEGGTTERKERWKKGRPIGRMEGRTTERKEGEKKEGLR